MGTYINENGAICYVRSGYSMSGNHADAHAHKRDMEEIANEVCDQKIKALMDELQRAIPQAVEEYGRQVFERLIQSIVGVLETDVNSEVRIALDGAASVFYGKAAQKYISDNIMKTLIKELNKIKNIDI